MNASDPLRFYIACLPGFESFLAGEYHALHLTRMKLKKDGDSWSRTLHGEESGGMEFEGTLEDIFKTNLHMRCASRVTVRLGDFIAITFAELRKKASRLVWEPYLKPGQKVRIEAVCHKSRLYHSDAVTERILAAINDHFSASGLPCEQSQAGQIIQVRLVNDCCTISIDSSGELLHKRGYRQAVAKAPLRENLAAGMIFNSGWDFVTPMMDPFCGSGTIPIEASLMAHRIAPGINRAFQFMKWPIFDQPLWEQVLSKARKEILESGPELFGFDRDKGAIEMAKNNAARAGQKDNIHFLSQAISCLEPSSEPGWIITNPPYGIRIKENKDLRDLYARFGTILKNRFSGWRLSLLSNEDKLSANLDLGDPIKDIRFNNGGISVKQLNFKI